MYAVGRFIPLLAIVLFALLAGADANANERAVLYDEDLSDPTGHQYLGSVKWRTEVTRLAGQSDEVAVVADVDIALRKFKMTLSLKRNFDKSLPASHVVELTFHLPPDFAGGGIGNVPGILMKSNELARGTALAGLSVKVTATPRVSGHEGLHRAAMFLICSYCSANNQINSKT